MKIDRLIGILSILLQKEKVTAPYLAEKFEVSRRTINRDIEHICKAGIPVVTMQGAKGGISIAEGYTIERILLSSGEMNDILTGLKGLDSIAGTGRYRQLMDKLKVEQEEYDQEKHIYIDLSAYSKESVAAKIELLKNAIEKKCLVTFLYIYEKGEKVCRVEPYLIVFQWEAWYVWSYDTEKEGMRLYKLDRINYLKIENEFYQKRELPDFKTNKKDYFAANYMLKALSSQEVKWRVAEEYGLDKLKIQEDGRLFFQFGFTSKTMLIQWLLSYGDQVEVIEPLEIRQELKIMIQSMGELYK